jgi:hypothetical protein
VAIRSTRLAIVIATVFVISFADKALAAPGRAQVDGQSPAVRISGEFVINRDSQGIIWLMNGQKRYLVDAPVTDSGVLDQFQNAGPQRQFSAPVPVEAAPVQVTPVPSATPVPATATPSPATPTPTPRPVLGSRANPLPQGAAWQHCGRLAANRHRGNG